MRHYKIGYIDGNDLKFHYFETDAENKEEAEKNFWDSKDDAFEHRITGIACVEQKEYLVCQYNGHEYKVCGTTFFLNTRNDGDDTVIIERCKLYEDGCEPKEHDINFHGHWFSDSEMAESLVRAYVNSNSDVVPVRVNDVLTTAKERFFEDSGVVIKNRPVGKRYIEQFYILDLQIVDKDGCSYYSDGNNDCILLRDDGTIATDYEEKYEEEIEEAINNGGLKYIEPSLEKYIKEKAING